MKLFLKSLSNVVNCDMKDIPMALNVLLEDNNGIDAQGNVVWDIILHDLLTQVDVWDLFSGPSLPISTLPKQIANVVSIIQNRKRAMQSRIWKAL